MHHKKRMFGVKFSDDLLHNNLVKIKSENYSINDNGCCFNSIYLIQNLASLYIERVG